MSDNNINQNRFAKQSAKKAHQKLINLLEQIRKCEHSALLLFSEMMHQKLYQELGYSSMLNYAISELKFSQSKAYGFIKMANDLEKLPETKKAVESGELGWTKARELVKVATISTEKQWLDRAKKSTRVDLVQKTKQAIDIAKNEAKQQPCLIPVEPLPKAEPKVSTSLSFSIEQGETGFSEELLIKALTDPRHEIRHVAKIGDQPKL